MASLAPFVRMVERRGINELRSILERTSEFGAPIIGTAHKTKGLEWSAVEIHPDFGSDEPSMEERRLFYVACTRAQFELGVDATTARPYMEKYSVPDTTD
jgi:superfamily I DNA/RNA helicase